MISSFVYVGREALEMMFLSLMVSSAIGYNWKLYASAGLGLLTGLIVGWLLGQALAPYDGAMYLLLSLLMLYLFYTSKDMAMHIKTHVEQIKQGQTGTLVGLFTIFFIFAREFMEIFTFMFQEINNTKQSWLGAALAIAIVFGTFPFIRKNLNTQTMFTVTRYAFLVFAVWFGYEAFENFIE